MNILKIQTDLLKNLIQKKPVVIGEWEGGVAIGDPTFLCFLPKDQMFLNINREPFDVKGFMKRNYDTYNYDLAEIKYIFDYEVEGKKYKVQKLEAKYASAYINRKVMKYFSKDASYYIYRKTSPVIVIEDDLLCGLIMPINVKEGDL